MTHHNTDASEDLVRKTLVKLLSEFMAAESLVQVRQIIDANPVILTDPALMLVRHYISNLEPSLSLLFTERLALLLNCQRLGTAQAFAELVLGNPDPQATNYFRASLRRFVACRTYDEIRQCVTSYPELLTNEAEGYLAELAQKERTTGDSQGHFFRSYGLLRFTRALGVDKMTSRTEAVVRDYYTFEHARSWEHSRDLLRQLPKLLEPEADEIIAALEAAELDPPTHRAIVKHRKLLQECRALGAEVAFAQFIGGLNAGRNNRMKAATTGFVQARTLTKLRAHFESYPELFGDGSHPETNFRRVDKHNLISIVDGVLDDIEHTLDPNDRAVFERNRRLLRRARQVGIAQTFDEELSTDEANTRAFQYVEAIALQVLTGRLALQEAIAAVQQPTYLAQMNDANLAELLDRLADPRESTPRLNPLVLIRAELTWAVVQAAVASTKQRSRAALSLTHFLNRAYQETGNPAILDRQIEIQRGILSLEPAPERSTVESTLINLNPLLSQRYRERGNPADLDASIDCFARLTELRGSAGLKIEEELNLGAALLSRHLAYGDETSLEAAIGYFRGSLDRITESHPAWETAMLNLGAALRNRAARTGTRDFEEAATIYDRLLKRAGPGSRRDGTLLNNLGLVYRDRYLQTGNYEALDKAISTLRQAAALATEGTWQQANRRANLGSMLVARSRVSSTGTDLDEAIGLFLSLTATANPQVPETMQWRVDLADALLHRYARSSQYHDLEQAITVLEAVLDEQPTGVHFSRLHHLLGRALGRRARIDQQEPDWQRALEMLSIAIEDEAVGNRWASLVLERGTLLAALYDQSGDLAARAAAVESFQQALKVISPENSNLNYVAGARDLLRLHVAAGDWREALEAGAKAIAGLTMRQRDVSAGTVPNHEVVLNLTSLYRQMVSFCVQLGDEPQYAREAFVYAEALRTSRELHTLTLGELPKPAQVPHQLLLEEQEARTALRERAALLISSPDTERADDARLAAYREARVRFDAVLDQLEAYPQAATYVALRRGCTQSWTELHQGLQLLEPGAAVVEFVLQPEGFAAIVFRAGSDAPTLSLLPIAPEQFEHRFLRPLVRETHDRRGQRRASTSWLQLGEYLWGPIFDQLADASVVYIVRDPTLDLFPLHALNVHGQPLIAHVPVVYASSAGALMRSLQHQRKVPQILGELALVMGYTAGEAQAERDIFLGEAQAIGKFLHSQSVTDSEATGAVLRRSAATASILHLSCHGSFNLDNPLASAVQLADGPFTASDWMRLHLDCDLVTLSACETGMRDLLAEGEINGLTQALLYAGARNALVTLWSVNSVTTLDWMLRFYGLAWDVSSGRRHESMAKAFQQATLQLRDKNPDPFYWAPYVLVGNGR